MGDAEIRRHLTGLRRRVLNIIADHGVVDAQGVLRGIAENPDELSARHREALPRAAADVLWRLDRLGWIERAPGGVRLTALGERARNMARPDL